MCETQKKSYEFLNQQKCNDERTLHQLPMVSVVMPVYNVQDYVGFAIDSVLEQTYQNFELVLIDDGSSDASFAICQAISEIDFRVRLLKQNNRGLAGARNTGIRASMGKYIAFLDSDDIWHKDKLAEHVALLEQNVNVGVSFNSSTFIDEKGSQLGLFQIPKSSKPKAKDLLLRNPIGNGSSPVIRKEVLNEIAIRHDDGSCHYFNESLRQSEDIECWVRIATTTAWDFQGIARPLTFYRVNNKGLSANVQKQFDSWSKACFFMSEYAPKLLNKFGRLAKAYQYRYLARRAVRSGDASNALKLTALSMLANPSILIREPVRTIVTISATFLLLLLPTSSYSLVESKAIQLSSSWHKPAF